MSSDDSLPSLDSVVDVEEFQPLLDAEDLLGLGQMRLNSPAYQAGLDRLFELEAKQRVQGELQVHEYIEGLNLRLRMLDLEMAHLVNVPGQLELLPLATLEERRTAARMAKQVTSRVQEIHEKAEKILESSTRVRQYVTQVEEQRQQPTPPTPSPVTSQQNME
ncbi:unnamed protein product, partial [Mesorhabditis spiculigera]